jgi:hypothetical protein
VPTTSTLARIRTLTPPCAALALAFVRGMEARGHRVAVTEGKRTRERQAELHALNPTGAAPPGSSRHELGEAFDWAFLTTQGVWSFDDTFPWAEGIALGESLGLVSGAHFPNRDKDHFELRRP